MNQILDDTNSKVNSNLLALINKSFLSTYLDPKLDITDISFNGVDLYISNNKSGRRKIRNCRIKNSEVLNFTRQIANLLGKNFNHTNPILDVSFDRYRLSAIYNSIARTKATPVITFSFRIMYEKLRINKEDTDFCPKEVHELLFRIVKCQQSVLISGPTGSGKTELQKYLVSLINHDEKIILIEDSYETCLKELLPNHDITSWVTNNQYGLSSLVKVALRNQPDWLIIAETRGEEVVEMIESVSTGHPLITTLHANNPLTVFDRIFNMGKNLFKLERNDLHLILVDYFNVLIQVKRMKVDQSYVRLISEIVEVYKEGNEVKYNLIYQNQYDEYKFYSLSDNLAKKLKINPKWY